MSFVLWHLNFDLHTLPSGGQIWYNGYRTDFLIDSKFGGMDIWCGYFKLFPLQKYPLQMYTAVLTTGKQDRQE